MAHPLPALAAVLLVQSGPVAAPDARTSGIRSPPATRARLSAAQMFALADGARDRGDVRTAEQAYRALTGDLSVQIRTEARFRLAMMFAAVGRLSDAASLFRLILDEQPNAQRVRLELGRVLDLLGDEAGARRALREAQAGGLPPDVARFVDRYSAALRAQKPFGASFELAVAPDSNINRATRSDTLGTVLGDFTLDDEARQRSGVGLAVRGQVYGRARLGAPLNLLGRVSGAADLYRHGEFNDVAISLSAGPELRLGSDRVAVEGAMTWRRFGGEAYATTRSLSLTYLHPLDRRSQLRATTAFGAINNKRNPLQDGRNYGASLTYERALSSRLGVGGSISGDRQDLADPGYSTTTGQISLFAYRELGALTLIGGLSYARLAADDRLFIYPRRRTDRLYRASVGATFRQFAIGGLAPIARVTYERNGSSIELFDYRRLRTEFGITRAF